MSHCHKDINALSTQKLYVKHSMLTFFCDYQNGGQVFSNHQLLSTRGLFCLWACTPWPQCEAHLKHYQYSAEQWLQITAAYGWGVVNNRVSVTVTFIDDYGHWWVTDAVYETPQLYRERAVPNGLMYSCYIVDITLEPFPTAVVKHG